MSNQSLAESHCLFANECYVYTADRLLGIDFPVIEEIVDGMFVAGRSCVIGGAYGAGKTTLCIQLGVGLAAGESVFGRRVGRAYRVGYFDLELGAAEFQERLRLARSSIQNTRKCDENLVYIDGSSESDMYSRFILQPDRDGQWPLADLIVQQQLEIVIIDNLSLAVPDDLTDPKVCMTLHRNLGLLRKRAPKLMLPFLPHHVVKPSREGRSPSLMTDPRTWLASIRGSGKLLDHITQRFGFDQEQQETCGSEFHVLNGINSHRIISPLLLEQDLETRQFRVSTDRTASISVILTPAERKVWNDLPDQFRYADVKKWKGSGYRMFEKAKDHLLIRENEPKVWTKVWNQWNNADD